MAKNFCDGYIADDETVIMMSHEVSETFRPYFNNMKYVWFR